MGELLEFHNGFNGSSEKYGRGIPLISVMDILSNDFITSENIRIKADLQIAKPIGPFCGAERPRCGASGQPFPT